LRAVDRAFWMRYQANKQFLITERQSANPSDAKIADATQVLAKYRPTGLGSSASGASPPIGSSSDGSSSLTSSSALSSPSAPSCQDLQEMQQRAHQL
jgi:hypothetical protein